MIVKKNCFYVANEPHIEWIVSFWINLNVGYFIPFGVFPGSLISAHQIAMIEE